ncbi:MAG TPA: TIGR03557 family F420-dependent LLM class oxidoreductase, partial [Umezawaea sp.]|nr:TIGR03557 family F420-dependent LLM class oxidoreductase [Umezawaea sp.]
MRIGYTLMTEQAGPRALVEHAAGAERAGFDFEVMSDHYFPWLDEQGHAPYAWSVLGAVSVATEHVDLMTYVTCPTMRYHPAVVAQKAATVQELCGGRFTLGLGSGENLNEHVIGRGWPPVNVRHEMLTEAIQIISQLFDGGYVDFVGQHFRVDSAKLWDLPSVRVPLAVAVSGKQSVQTFAPVADTMVAVEPDAELCRSWDVFKGDGGAARKVGQLPVSWGVDRAEAVARAHEQFRWFAGGWKVNADLPTTEAFDAASQFVRPSDVAEQIPCGPDLDAVVEAASAYWEAGFTDLAIVQIGDELQDEFLE